MDIFIEKGRSAAQYNRTRYAYREGLLQNLRIS